MWEMRRDEGGRVCGGETLGGIMMSAVLPEGTGDYVMVARHTLGSAL